MRRFMLLLVWLLPALLVTGQRNLYLKAGANLTDMKLSTSRFRAFASTRSSTLYHFGLSSSLLRENSFSLDAELLYSVKGATLSISQLEQSKLRFGYVTLPLLVSYHFDAFSLGVGSEVGYLLRLEQDPAPPHNFSLWDHQWDWSGLINLNYHLYRWQLSLRYLHSLKGVVQMTYTDEQGTVLDQDRLGRHQVIQVSLGYRLLGSR